MRVELHEALRDKSMRIFQLVLCQGNHTSHSKHYFCMLVSGKALSFSQGTLESKLTSKMLRKFHVTVWPPKHLQQTLGCESLKQRQLLGKESLSNRGAYRFCRVLQQSDNFPELTPMLGSDNFLLVIHLRSYTTFSCSLLYSESFLLLVLHPHFTC